MKDVFGKLKLLLINMTYVIVMFAAAFLISTLALTRRINSYESSLQPISLNVQKEEISITNSVSGRVESIKVVNGQHVRKNDVLVLLYDDASSARLKALKSVEGENISAKAEAKVIQAKESQYVIRAPRDGVIYKILVNEGSYAREESELLTLFADDNVKLVGYMNVTQYSQLDKNRELSVFSQRFEEEYGVVLEGAGRVISATQSESAKYELQFAFMDQTEGAAFIQGEALSVIVGSENTTYLSPARKIARIWNSFIIDKQ